MLTLINRTGNYFIKYVIEQLKLEMVWNFNGKKYHMEQSDWEMEFLGVFLKLLIPVFQNHVLNRLVCIWHWAIAGDKRLQKGKGVFQAVEQRISNQIHKFASISVSLSLWSSFSLPSLSFSHSVPCFLSHFYVHTPLERLGWASSLIR